MQRCPYLYEMKERLLLDKGAGEPLIMDSNRDQNQQPMGTIVQLNPDGYGSHISLEPISCDLCPLEQPTSLLLQDCNMCPNDIVYPKNAKTSLFIITSFIYAKLLVVICIAYVVSEMITHRIPHYYYEGFFTYLYGMSILFLLYVFCFLLQESSCCAGGNADKVPTPKEKKSKAVKEKKPKKEKPPKKEKDKKSNKDEPKDVPVPPALPPSGGEKGALSQESYPRKQREKFRERQQLLRASSNNQFELCECHAEGVLKNLKKPEGGKDTPNIPEEPREAATADKSADKDAELEAGLVVKQRRKTSQNHNSFGSFFLRVGAIAFGLGTMISTGLEIGKFVEVPLNSPCFLILNGVNPLLQLIFTFMQMYFIFLNSRLNIHRFKFIARFGLMHVVATNLCVWIRTLVVESLKEITQYHVKVFGAVKSNASVLQDSIKEHTLRNAGALLGTRVVIPDILPSTTSKHTFSTLSQLARSSRSTFTTPSTTTQSFFRLLTTPTTTIRTTLSTTPPTTTTTTIPTTTTTTPFFTTTTTTASTPFSFGDWGSNSGPSNVNYSGGVSSWDSWLPNAEMLIGQPFYGNATGNGSCNRVNIMGTIVQDSAPYLYPFIIEYSLIAAAVIYIMWRHIGHYPRVIPTEDLERRLEAMLSNRAVALARAHQGRVDCVGASKGLFFGLLLLVGALICLILFFVLIRHQKLGLLAIYLADASHCVLLLFSILAIIIGFCRIRTLKFKCREHNDLNDILLRVSAFGLFLYAAFSVIAGGLNALEKEPNLLVTVTGLLVILQTILQLLFISDASRRRVHLPEHDRSKPGRQIVTFLLILNLTMWIIYTFEAQKVVANPVQLDFYGYLPWILIQRVTLPLCIFHRFHSAVALAEIWKSTYKPRLD